MFRTCLTTIAAISFAFAADAQDKGLNNWTKRFTDPSQMNQRDWSDPNEMHRAWLAAIVRVPTGKARSKRIKVSRLANWRPRSESKLPVVIYMHGCSGFWPGTYERTKFMAKLGFVVIAPASFAREKYPQSCDTDTHQGGLYRGTLKMRQNDAAYAIAQARKLPFVNPDKIILMGLSQGGITTATLPGNRYASPLAARIVEGWTCHAGWAEYKGINARSSEPVLTMVGKEDPWFQNEWTRGNCGRYIRTGIGSRSVVYASGHLAREHELLNHDAPRQEVVLFLKGLGLTP